MKMSSKKSLVLSGIVLGIGLLFGFITPPLFKSFVKSQLNLLPQSDLRGLYTKTPFFLNFKVYVFNLTNPDEVTEASLKMEIKFLNFSGNSLIQNLKIFSICQRGKPKLQEIGPYFFEEWKEKFDLVDNDDEDTLTYHYKNSLKFRPDLSASGLTGNEIITMPHPVMSTTLLAANLFRNKKVMQMAKTATTLLFNEPKHMFYTGRVMDILFDGIPINCTSEQYQAQAVCLEYESGEIKSIRPINKTHYAFSLLGQGNATDLGEFKVFRGNKNSQDLGRVVSFNKKLKMNDWGAAECNEYRGTDSTIFPPYMNESDGIWAYEPSICRSLGAHYVGKSTYMGVETSEFAVDIGSAENSKQCYCSTEDTCPKKGTFDMFPCVGAPMMGSLPHFYGADPSLLADFESGIKPEKARHEAYLHVEMTTGTILSGAKRLQFNLAIVPIHNVSYMANLREMYYPMFWLEESAALNETYVNQIDNTVILVLKTQNFLKWTGIIIGICGIIISGIFVLLTVRSNNKRMSLSSLGSRNGGNFIDKQRQSK